MQRVKASKCSHHSTILEWRSRFSSNVSVSVTMQHKKASQRTGTAERYVNATHSTGFRLLFDLREVLKTKALGQR